MDKGGKLAKSRSAGYIRRASAAIDVEPFSVTNFSSSNYLKTNMPVDTDEAIQNIHRTLQYSHEGTVFELGKSFYRNHNEFIAVAREAERFESDLSAMRAMISQLKAFGTQITGEREIITEATQPPSAKPAPSQLAPIEETLSPTITKTPEIGEEVRGKIKKISELIPEAAEFLVDSTNVLLESAEMAVYVNKQWKPAQAWALSNGCLIANRKAKVSITQGVRQKVGFECFVPFDKCILADVKDTPDLQNCFKLKGPNGSVFLHSSDAAIKAIWYSTIDARLKEISAAKEKPQTVLSDAVGKQVKSVANHRRTGSMCTSGAASKPSMELTFLDQQPELAPERLFVMQGNLNDLADLIYRTQYDIAVDQLDRLNQELMAIPYNSPNINLIRVRLQELRSTLIKYILQELNDPLISKESMAGHVQRLIVLGCTEEARERFLNNRAELIKSKTKKIHFYGDVFASTALLSAITFDSIEMAFDWYNFSFRDPKLVAGFISWARNEISRFCDLFARQAFRPDLSTEIVAACVVDALENCRRLGYSGLDLTIFLQEKLGNAIGAALESRASAYYVRVEAAIEADEFDTTLPVDTPDWPKMLIPLSGHKVTTSLSQLAVSSVSLLEEMRPLMQSKLVSYCAANLGRFVYHFAERFMTIFYDRQDTTSTRLVNLAGNMSAIAELILPSLGEQFIKEEVGEIDNLQARLHATTEALYEVVAEGLGKQLSPKDFSFYAQPGAQSELSTWVKEAIPALSKLARDSPAARKQKLVDGALRSMVNTFDYAFSEELVKVSPGGLSRFVVDWRLILKLIGAQLISHETREQVDKIVQRAKEQVSGGDLDAPLPRGQAIDEELIKLESSFATFSLDFGNEK